MKSGLPEDHFRKVAKAILRGDVVPVLGAGANRCDRAPGEAWRPGDANLPDGGELAAVLADEFDCMTVDRHDLVRVSQAAVLSMGDGPVFKLLHRMFAGDHEPTSLHRLLARIPKLMLEREIPVRPQIIVTTNYDNLVERAFEDAGEPFDLLYYLAQGDEHHRDRGKFVHIGPDGERHPVRKPKKYMEVRPDARPVVLKVHGAARPDQTEDSWVITEDNYIDYLTNANLSELVPVKVLERLLGSHFLFLGYALKDWNLRVMLHRVWTQRDNSWESWAVQLDPDPLDKAFWNRRQVAIQAAPLHDYVVDLEECLSTVELSG